MAFNERGLDVLLRVGTGVKDDATVAMLNIAVEKLTTIILRCDEN
jgi:hypothetical protein